MPFKKREQTEALENVPANVGTDNRQINSLREHWLRESDAEIADFEAKHKADLQARLTAALIRYQEGTEKRVTKPIRVNKGGIRKHSNAEIVMELSRV